MFVLYFLLALGATFIGSMTGMGGGIIMKPIMDALSHFDTASISILSSVTVLAMSAVSCLRRFLPTRKRADTKSAHEPPKKAGGELLKLVLLALGSVLGGYLGQQIFDALTSHLSGVKVVQNAVMLALVAVIFFYMLFKEKLPRLMLTSGLTHALLGLFMGIISSFLGIGGGPVNVALLSFVIGMDIKSAVFASLLSVLFTQISKLLTVLITVGFSSFDLSMLPFMVIGGVIGATVGSHIARKLSQKATNILFCAAQLLIFGICLYNIFS